MYKIWKSVQNFVEKHSNKAVQVMNLFKPVWYQISSNSSKGGKQLSLDRFSVKKSHKKKTIPMSHQTAVILLIIVKVVLHISLLLLSSLLSMSYRPQFISKVSAGFTYHDFILIIFISKFTLMWEFFIMSTFLEQIILANQGTIEFYF